MTQQADEQREAMTDLTAPHPVLQSASFVMAFSGEGAAAYVVHGGWEAMLLRFVQEAINYAATALPDPGSVHAEEWALWMADFNDLDGWSSDEASQPYCFSSEIGEISRVAIYRLAAALPPAAVQAWIPVTERLPDEEVPVMVFTPAMDGDEERIDFEFRYEGCWHNHNDCYDHFMAVGGYNAVPGEVCTGPDSEAPYTHWMPIPASPLAANEGTLTAGKQAEPYSWAADGMRRDPDGNWVLREAPFLLQKEEGDSALLAYLESQKFHPSASHVPPDYRDGYNHALRTVIERIRTNAAIATRQGEKP